MSDINSINYQPLYGMKNAWRQVVKSSFHGHGWVVAIVAVVVGIGLLPFGGVGVIILFGYVVYMGWQYQKYEDKVWQDFAVANGWSVDGQTSQATLTAPSINYGHSQHFSPPIKAQLGSVNCDLYVYDTTTGEGKYQTAHFFTLAMVTLPKNLPHIILNSKKGKADIKTLFPDHEKLNLEGDFNNYFNLLVTKGEEINVLTILTPDVMQTLVNTNAEEDIEINGQQLYFILRNDKRNPESMKMLLSSVEILTKQITQNISLEQVPQASQAS